MGLLRRVAGNSRVIFLGDAFAGVVNFGVALVLIRHLGSEGFGRYALVTSFILQFLIFEDIWLKPLLVREISKHPHAAGHLIGNGIILKLVLASVIGAAVLAVMWLLRYPPQIWCLTALAGVNILLLAVITTHEAVFRAKLAMSYCVGVSVAGKLLFALFVLAAVSLRYASLEYFLTAMIVTNALVLWLQRMRLKKILPPETVVLDVRLWRRLLSDSSPLFFSALFISLYSRLDHILLFHLRGASELGRYAAAVKIAESLQPVTLAAAGSLLPLLSRCYPVSKETFRKVYDFAFRGLSLFLVPVVIATIVYADALLHLFYGADFVSSRGALGILVVAQIFVFFGIINNKILIASGFQRMDPLFTGASVLLNIALNSLLIPRFGFLGSAAAALCSYATGPLLGFAFVSTRPYSKCMFQSLAKPLIASAAMAALFLRGRQSLFLVLAAPLAYLAVIGMMGGVEGTRRDPLRKRRYVRTDAGK